MASINTITTDDQIEIYENNILLYLDQYIMERDIKDMSKEPQSKWNAALYYIYKYVFKNNDFLKADNYITGNLKYGNDSNCNAYNTDKVNDICDIYINMCYEYCKEISIVGFCRLTGIARDTIYQWGKDERKLNSSSSDIYKKLDQEHEESLRNRLYSSSNIVGPTVLINHDKQYNVPGIGEKGSQRQIDVSQLYAKYGISQDDKQDTPQITTQDEPPKPEF